MHVWDLLYDHQLGKVLDLAVSSMLWIDLGLRIEDSGFMVSDSGFRVEELGIRV